MAPVRIRVLLVALNALALAGISSAASAWRGRRGGSRRAGSSDPSAAPSAGGTADDRRSVVSGKHPLAGASMDARRPAGNRRERQTADPQPRFRCCCRTSCWVSICSSWEPPEREDADARTPGASGHPRGDAVIVIDPKGDEGLLKKLRLAAGERFRLFSLPHPKQSVRYNPIGRLP